VDTLVTVFAVALGILPLVGALVVIAVGLRRLRSGRTTRLDPVFDAMARAQSAGVYPHSLRGHVDQQIEYGAEAERSSHASRRTPGLRRRRRRDRRSPRYR
jgi:hypothetical protein